MRLGLEAVPLCPTIWYQIKGALFFCWSSNWPPGLDSQYPLGPKVKEPKYACMSESKASYSHRMWTEVSSSAPHFPHKGLLIKPIKLRCLLRVLCLVRRPVRTLYCVLLEDSNLVFLVWLGPEISFRACLWVLLGPHHIAKCWFSTQRFIFSFIFWLETPPPKDGSGRTNFWTEHCLVSWLAISKVGVGGLWRRRGVSRVLHIWDDRELMTAEKGC